MLYSGLVTRRSRGLALRRHASEVNVGYMFERLVGTGRVWFSTSSNRYTQVPHGTRRCTIRATLASASSRAAIKKLEPRAAGHLRHSEVWRLRVVVARPLLRHSTTVVTQTCSPRKSVMGLHSGALKYRIGPLDVRLRDTIVSANLAESEIDYVCTEKSCYVHSSRENLAIISLSEFKLRD